VSTTEHLSSTGGQDGGRHPRRLRLLVVCVGNHIRSPIAAAVLAAQGGDDVVVRSAGLRYRHVGKGPTATQSGPPPSTATTSRTTSPSK
jgi:hypothetical protein